MGQISLDYTDDIPVSAIRSIYNTLKSLEDAPKDHEWVVAIKNVIQYSKKMEKGFELVRAYALTLLNKAWDEIPVDTKKTFGFTFIQVAMLWCEDWKSSTIYNYIDVVDTWITNDVTRQVAIPARTETGKPIIENGKQVVEYVEFDPAFIPISKLVAAKSAFKRGNMTDKTWELLVDPFATRDDLARAISPKKVTDTPKFFLEGSLLFILDGHEAFVADLNFDEYDTDELVKKSIDKILDMLGVERDEDAIHRIEHASIISVNTGNQL